MVQIENESHDLDAVDPTGYPFQRLDSGVQFGTWMELSVVNQNCNGFFDFGLRLGSWRGRVAEGMRCAAIPAHVENVFFFRLNVRERHRRLPRGRLT